MYLTAHDIAQGRAQTLDNLFALADNCLNAGQRLAELFAANARHQLDAAAARWAEADPARPEALGELPTGAWIAHCERSGDLIENAIAVIGETHKAWLRSAETQIHIIDQSLLAGARHASRNGPWESQVALATLREQVASAENILHDANETLIERIEQCAGDDRPSAPADLAEAPPTRATGRRGGKRAASADA